MVKTHGKKTDGYRGIWYGCNRSNDEFIYKYSGGLGTYCAKHLPLAIYAKEVNKTFFCYGGSKKKKNSLLHMVSYFDHNTGLVPKPTILLNKKTTDAHDNPTMQMDDKGYIWIYSSSHGVSRPSYIHKSVRPYSIDKFEIISKTNFSYPQSWFVPKKGFLFLHTRYENPGSHERVLYWMTSEDGKSWSDPKVLSYIERGHYQISNQYKNKVGTAFNYHPDPMGLNYRTNLYYAETKDFGDSWTDVEGKALKLPLKSKSNQALVRDYEEEKKLVYMKDINFDEDGNPVILYLVSNGHQSGPENNPRIWTVAYWTGTKWEYLEAISSDSNYDTGSIFIESKNKWKIIGPSDVGPQLFNPGGEISAWEIDIQNKTSMKIMQMTKGSKKNHTYVRRVVNGHPDFYAFWADGNPRKLSESNLYFCNKECTKVYKLPSEMKDDFAKPLEI